LLRWRLISSAVILSVLLALVALDYRQALGAAPGLWLLPVLLAVSMLGTEEVLALFAAKGHRPVAWVPYLGNVLITLAACLPMLFQLAGRTFPPIARWDRSAGRWWSSALAAAGVLAAEMQRFKRPGRATVDAALGIFTLVYIGLLGSFLALLRQYDSNSWGMAALVSMLLVVKDGRCGGVLLRQESGPKQDGPDPKPRQDMGRGHRRRIGGVPGVVGLFQFLAPAMIGSTYEPPPLFASLAYGAILAFAGMLGDLAESLLKRDMERKDSSSWIPGLGGVLDIVDAILVAAPIAWLCWVFGLVGP
jgi:phosphatidate cytidylyltransferase